MQLGPCCFCGRDIAPAKPNPLSVTVETSDGKAQVWFAHAKCFKEKLVDVPGAPGFLDPAYF